MKKTKKYLLILIFSFLVIAAVTVCADLFAQYLQNYAAAPFVKAGADTVLTADEILFETPEDDATPERAPYLLGWLRDEDVPLYRNWKYRISGVKAQDARTDAEAELIENAGYHIFTTEENTTFDSLLRQLRFRPLKGMKNILTHRKISKNNFVASFWLRTFFSESEYDDAFSSLISITLTDRKIMRGEIFTVVNKVFLAGCFRVGSIFNEEKDVFEDDPDVPKYANNEQYSLFEIKPSESLDALLSQRELFAGGKNERISRYAPYTPERSAKIALLIETAVFLLSLLLILTRNKKLSVRLLSLLAAFAVTVCGTLAVVLTGEYKALFRPCVYNAEDGDNLYYFDEIFSDVSQELLDHYNEGDWQPIVTVSHRLQFAHDASSYTPEEFSGQTALIYAEADWRSRYFSKADVDEFAGLLRELKYHPVKGVKGLLTAARMTESNAFGDFVREHSVNILEDSYFEDEPCFPCAVWDGQFFLTGGHTYLLASFRMDPDLGRALDAKYRQGYGFNRSFAVFEIAEGDALNRLLEKQDDFRGEPLENRDNAYYRWFPSGWVTGEAVLFALLALYILIDHKKNRSTAG